MAPRITLDLALEYQLPLNEATSDPAGVEFETEGFAVRFGVVMTPW